MSAHCEASFRENDVIVTTVQLPAAEDADPKGVLAVLVFQIAVRETAMDGIPCFIRLEQPIFVPSFLDSVTDHLTDLVIGLSGEKYPQGPHR